MALAVTVTVAWTALSSYRPAPGSKLADDSSDAESRTRLLVLVSDGPNDYFQIDLLAQSEVVPPGGLKSAVSCDPFSHDTTWFFAIFASFVVEIRVVLLLCEALAWW